MKNIHVIPTDKPSKIGYHTDIVKEGRLDYAPNFGFSEFNKERNFQHRPHNIYITSDEEIISFNEINSLPLLDGKDIQTNMSNI